MAIGFYTKWIISGIVLLIIVSVGCVLWFRYDTAPYRQEASETAELIRQRETTQKADANGEAAPAAEAAAESETPTVEKQRTNITPVTKDIEPTQAQTHLSTENAETAEVRVSPHGFGPFPEVPEDYPHQDVFETISDDPAYELMDRVRIKLWKQGVQTIGIHGEGGLFYPTIPGTIYIEHERIDYGNGVVFSSRSLSGDPEALQSLGQINWNLPLEQISFPSNIKVIDAKEGGINPYIFLDLQKE
ncbi:hypothetical protein J4G08_01195 [Candidatus Poribacteria bacterium]|nr:hypothetical protein [Candidatus Poribacteria bacterium]